MSLRVGRGSWSACSGRHGAGKSTLINVIAGLHRARGGRLSFDGRDITQLASHRFCAAGIAIVPEGRRLFTAMSVQDNLALGSYLPGARAQRAQTLEQVLALFPALEQKLPHPAGSLSGGQQQMVAIGRALMSRPQLLLLDEPSLGLAPTVVMDMFSAIREINARGTSVLLVEQNVVMAMELARRAYVMEEAHRGRGIGRLMDAGDRKAYLGLETH